jgi:hypothetical protein
MLHQRNGEYGETASTYAYAATYNICKSESVYHLSLDGQNEKVMVF